jgi:DMSO reductase anchor subunit
MEHLLQILTNSHVDIITAVLGIVTAFVTQLVKNLSAIPISEGQTTRIRMFATVLAFGGTFLNAWANGDLASADFLQYVGVAVQGVVTYFFAHITYKSVIKDPNA